MKVPEKIYIHPDIGGREFTRTWSKRRVSQDSVEYARTDAFIEKACKAYCKMCKMPNCRANECKFIDKFRNYMKGE